MSRYYWILDPGHGGIDPSGKYVTHGKRSPSVPPGIYEGEFNRAIAERLRVLMQQPAPYDGVKWSMDCTVPIIDGRCYWGNVQLKGRKAFINRMCAHVDARNVRVLSIHANAAHGQGWTPAKGTVTFHRDSPEMAQDFDGPLISDACRGIKTAKFSVLNVPCPAVLIEVGFMTNRFEAEYMASETGRDVIANQIYARMVRHELRSHN
jgi:N-acetylmuramoyl-L-alanine amidase